MLIYFKTVLHEVFWHIILSLDHFMFILDFKKRGLGNGLLAHLSKNFRLHGFRSIGTHDRKLYAKTQMYTAVNLPFVGTGDSLLQKRIHRKPKYKHNSKAPDTPKRSTWSETSLYPRPLEIHRTWFTCTHFTPNLEAFSTHHWVQLPRLHVFNFIFSWNWFPLKLVQKFYIILVRKDARLQEICLQGRVKRNTGYSQLSNWLVSWKLPINDTYFCGWQF